MHFIIFYFVERLGDMLQQLDDETLSQTYRVLSLAVSDVDECENRASRNNQKKITLIKQKEQFCYFIYLYIVLAQRRQKLGTRMNEMTVSSLNRDFVVSIPGLLGKVLNYACSLPCNFSIFFSMLISNLNLQSYVEVS